MDDQNDRPFPHCDRFILSTHVYFSKDQEEIETYVPLLADNTLIAFFLLIYVFALIAIQMPYILVEVMIALIPTYILLKYGWRAIDVMKRMDLESRTPWYQHTLATVTGLSIIRTFKKENEAIDLFYELEDDNSSAYFLFFNSLRRVFELIVKFLVRISFDVIVQSSTIAIVAFVSGSYKRN